jgi:peroxiredoxin-like protein
MQENVCESAARWTEGHRGLVECDQTSVPLEFSAPVQFQGDPGYWTPEHLLLAAVASCFITTFRVLSKLSRFEFTALEVSVRGTVEKGIDGYQFGMIIIRPVLTINQQPLRERGLRLLEKAEQACMISRSLKPPVQMKAQVEVATSSAMV